MVVLIRLSSETDSEQDPYRKVKATGRYLNERSVFIGPRTRAQIDKSKPPEHGYHVITPLRCRDSE